MKVLFRGWFNIPHSYSLVNCFQIINLYKKYNDKIQFYIEEMEYFNKSWNEKKKLVYSNEYNDIINNLEIWNGEPVDLIYSITYPYNITIEHETIPKVVFFTSEFAALNNGYFTINGLTPSEVELQNYFKTYKNIHMICPSKWSEEGMMKYTDKTTVLTHGVDQDVFKPDLIARNKIRNFYKIKDDDILLINIGAMTKNKGVMQILVTLNMLVNKLDKKHYKLFLKGSGDLYTSKDFLEIYFKELIEMNFITKNEMDSLLENHIIFTDKTLSYDMIKGLFNAADLYLSPYLAEGFNLTPLESLSAGLPVMVPETGSTKEYIADLYVSGGHDYIHYIKSNVIESGGMKQNNIDINVIINKLLEIEPRLHLMKNERFNRHKILNENIKLKYSWEFVADKLYEYFVKLTNLHSISKSCVRKCHIK